MTAANYISIGALIISLVMMIYNIYNGNKRNDEQEQKSARDEQAQTTSLMLSLNNIEKQLMKIENTIDTVQKDTRDNHDQLIVVEQSLKCQTAHCGRRKPHVDFGTSASPTAQSRG